MNCSACGNANPDEARYCGHCGAALAEVAVCPSCGAGNPRENAYCNACGQTLADAGAVAPGARRDGRSGVPERLAGVIRASRGQLEGERKQVTVLFADVVGSTKLAERAGPERWRAVIDRFFALLCGAVHRFDGIVDRFTGDGAMAVFGAPLADEQHALHACHAALEFSEELVGLSAELRREQGLNVVVRIGLNSGEVVVGAIGEDLDIKYTAVGPTVALAKRMEGLAEPGKTYLTQTTAREVHGYFELRDLGRFDVKGVGEPVKVYELAGPGGVRTALELARAHGLSRFVGREQETQALRSALAHARADNGQVVCVVGEAGVGKSRLVYEFAEHCREEQLEVWEAHCRARGETLALMPLLELLRAYFAISDRDPDAVAREKIAGRVLLLDPSLKDELPLLFELLGISDPHQSVARIDPEARQRRLFAMLNRSVAGRSERPVVVFVFEDLQWIDPGSAAFLESLIDALPGTHTLVVASFRPEYRAEWTQRSYCGRLALAPLAASSSRELLDDLLGMDASLAGVVARIDERAEGNPFFIEELVRGLVEDGSLVGSRGAYRLARPVDEKAIPATVQAVIAARIDRFGEREKQLLQAASVIGRWFAEPVLVRVSGISQSEVRVALRALLAGELIYERTLLPEPTYVFAHQLIMEVAYSSQLTEPRAQLHERVAIALEELYPDKLEELAALISHHLEQAGERLAAARWGVRAALWAGSADPTGASRQWRRVRALSDRAPDSPEAVSIRIWSRIAVMAIGRAEPQEIRAAFEQARALAEQSGDVRSLAMVVGMYAYTRVLAGEVAPYIDMHLESLRLAEQAGDPGMRVAMVGVPFTLFFAGRWREALEIMEPWFALWAEDPTLGAGSPIESPYATAIWLRALMRHYLGELTIQQTRAQLDQALALMLEHGDFGNASMVYTARVGLCYLEGDGETALRQANEAMELAERTGGSSTLHHLWAAIGQAHILRGEWDQAIAAEKRALEHGSPGDALTLWDPVSLSQLADAYLGAGQPERARDTATRAVEISTRAGACLIELWAQLALARALIGVEAERVSEQLTHGAEAELTATLARVETLIEQMDCRAYEPFLHEARARLAELTGDTPTYARELGEAQHQWDALGAHPRAAALSAELAPAAAS